MGTGCGAMLDRWAPDRGLEGRPSMDQAEANVAWIVIQSLVVSSLPNQGAFEEARC